MNCEFIGSYFQNIINPNPLTLCHFHYCTSHFLPAFLDSSDDKGQGSVDWHRLQKQLFSQETTSWLFETLLPDFLNFFDY